MWPLSGQSTIITGDEVLEVYREGTELGPGESVNYVDGKKVVRNPEVFEMVCNVQPILGKDLLLVPEHDRYRENFWVFTNKEERALHVNDFVIRQGESQVWYQVQTAEDWGSFIQARIMRVDTGPNASQ